MASLTPRLIAFQRTFLVASVLFTTLPLQAAFAQEAVLDSKPIVSDAQGFEGPADDSFKIEPDPEKASWDWRKSLEESAPFFKDTSLKLNLRTFYFNRDEAAETAVDKESWALGGSLAYKSGKIYEVFGIGAELFTSQKLYGPEDKDGALLLEPGQDGYTAIGVANPRFDYQGHALTLYRQRMELPYVNSQDNRMTPNTFESYSYGFLGEGDKPPYQLGLGYIDRIKKRNTEHFVSMSEAAGVSGAERGMPWLGARLRPVEDLKIAVVDFAGIDFLNFFYTDLDYEVKFSEQWKSKSSIQFSEQRSMGEDLLTGSDMSATMWGVQQGVSYGKLLFRLALTVNDKGMIMRSPFGSYPGYNSSIVDDFNRAGETAWKVGVSYDFAELGIDGLSAYADYISGNGAVDSAKNNLNDKSETDVNIDYRIREGTLKGFWLRLRGGFVDEDNVGTTNDFRVIVNYELPII